MKNKLFFFKGVQISRLEVNILEELDNFMEKELKLVDKNQLNTKIGFTVNN